MNITSWVVTCSEGEDVRLATEDEVDEALEAELCGDDPPTWYEGRTLVRVELVEE